MYQSKEQFLADYEWIIEELEGEKPGWRTRAKEILREIIQKAEERVLAQRDPRVKIDAIDLWDVKIGTYMPVETGYQIAVITGTIFNDVHSYIWVGFPPTIKVHVSLQEGEELSERLKGAKGETVNVRYNNLTLLIHTSA